MKYLPRGENLAKIDPADPEIICLQIFAYAKLQSYWTKVHQIKQKWSQIIKDESSLLKSQFAIFQAILECEGDKWKWIGRFSPILALKLVAMATFLEPSFCENRSSRSWDHFNVYFEKKEKKKLTQAEHIAREAYRAG